MKQKIAALIVEDNMDDFLILKRVLKASEEVETTIFHEEMLEGGLLAAKQNPIDVAILDLSLPDSFGLETFTAFHEQYPIIPTIIMTGSKDQEMAYEAVGNGAQDYLFKNELSAPTIVRCIRYAIERQRLKTELQLALNHVQQLQGLLPICSVCKNIRDDQGYWNRVEQYMSRYLEVQFTHSICPDCAKKYYPEFSSSNN